jgi:hypothetical protein
MMDGILFPPYQEPAIKGWGMNPNGKNDPTFYGVMVFVPEGMDIFVFYYSLCGLR